MNPCDALPSKRNAERTEMAREHGPGTCNGLTCNGPTCDPLCRVILSQSIVWFPGSSRVGQNGLRAPPEWYLRSRVQGPSNPLLAAQPVAE